jgi:hypothetical protein
VSGTRSRKSSGKRKRSSVGMKSRKRSKQQSKQSIGSLSGNE